MMLLIRHRLARVLLVGLLMMLCACDKKCQQPPTQPITSITAQQWRLVSTTDPAVESQGLNNMTFSIWQFNVDFTGTVTQVSNNREAQQPTKVFDYNVDPNSDTLVLSITDPPPTQNGQPTQQASQSPAVVAEYSYDLSTELDLTDTQRGYTYRFVPFEGVVQPDEQCSF